MAKPEEQAHTETYAGEKGTLIFVDTVVMQKKRIKHQHPGTHKPSLVAEKVRQGTRK